MLIPKNNGTKQSQLYQEFQFVTLILFEWQPVINGRTSASRNEDRLLKVEDK